MKRCGHRGFPVTGKFCEYHGLVYPTPPCFQMGEEPTEIFDELLIPKIESDIGDLFLMVETPVKAPWHLWVANSIDFRHVRTTHPQFHALLCGKPFKVQISADRRRSSHKIFVDLDVAVRYEEMCGIEDSLFIHAINASETEPHLSITSFLGTFYSYERAERTKDGCLVTTAFYKSKTRLLPDLVYSAAEIANRQILEEDKALVETWAKGYRDLMNWLPGEARLRAYNDVLKEDGIIP